MDLDINVNGEQWALNVAPADVLLDVLREQVGTKSPKIDLIQELGIHQHDSGHCSILQYGRFLYACTSNGVSDNHLSVPAPEAPSLVVVDKLTGRLAATARRLGRRERLGGQAVERFPPRR